MNNTLLQTCATVLLVTTLKIILIYVYGYEKRKSKYIFTDWNEIRTENLIFIIFDKYPIYRAAVKLPA